MARLCLTILAYSIVTDNKIQNIYFIRKVDVCVIGGNSNCFLLNILV